MSQSPRQKKNKPKGPRRKRMSREARLQSAKALDWVHTYTGKNIVRGYRKWFGVDLICAITELRVLGVDINEEYEKRVTQSIKICTAQKKQRKLAKEQDSLHKIYSDADDTFAFIAGYTAGGFPYGVTWEEIGEDPPWMQDEKIEKS